MTKIRDEDLPGVADVYRKAFEIGQGHRATTIVAQAFGVQRTTAWRWIDKAVEQGLVQRYDGDHRPLRARWASASEANGGSWVACATCHTPWPCAEMGDQ